MYSHRHCHRHRQHCRGADCTMVLKVIPGSALIEWHDLLATSPLGDSGEHSERSTNELHMSADGKLQNLVSSAF
ncbi:hypothetical protein M5D96_009244 [Drosophila gunungcola]|uniref:Uncharacterized protein n=1 Tax=Drosophila gunungcola TaxID=103775 RepID=A0A9Q0BNA9_9MUSC|nr:hypothetical protein M5D96_009244 [Drosophila gunungcola]